MSDPEPTTDPFPVRPLRQVVPESLAWLYLPQTLPFFAGPLMECDHCVRAFLSLFAFLPGAIPGILLGDGWWIYPISAGLTFVAFMIVFNTLGTLCARGPRLLIGLFFGVLSAGNAWAISHALRA